MAKPKPFIDKKYTPPERANNSAERDLSRNFLHERIGSGNVARYSDERGTWWGNEDPNEAGVFITMGGKIILRASALQETSGIEFYDEYGNLSIFIGFEE